MELNLVQNAIIVGNRTMHAIRERQYEVINNVDAPNCLRIDMIASLHMARQALGNAIVTLQSNETDEAALAVLRHCVKAKKAVEQTEMLLDC